MTTARRAGLAALALIPLSLLSHLSAAVPGATYYFRDFSVTFYPLRALQSAELAAGRWLFWNPYLHGGTFVLPAFYPLEWLHVLWPGPAAVSWLLTLHFPWAALGAYVLARRLGLAIPGAAMAGVVYALGGLAVSSLNLYVFLQALAWAPWVVAALERAAEHGGRTIVLAALAVGTALSTLALEFVAQALLLGGALGLGRTPTRAGLGRLLASVVLGAGLAGVPLAVTASLLPETVRGQGFEPAVALGNELRPIALLQVVAPNIFGALSAPVDLWWGGAFFSKGFPYFLSLYLGPLVLAFAAVGRSGLSPAPRRILLVSALLGFWYALGVPAGLAAVVSWLPGTSWFRFPIKAWLLPHLAAALLAGAGLQVLARGAGWRVFAGVSGAIGTAGLVAAALATAVPRVLTPLVPPGSSGEAIRRYILRDTLEASGMALFGLLLAAVASRGHISPPRGAGVAAAVAILALARAGAGVNPQTTASFFDLVPELRAEGLSQLDGGRTFTFGLDGSPAFRRFLASPRAGKGLWSFFLSRQLLAPYTNLLDRVEIAESKDLTAFVPYAPEIGLDEYAPEGVAAVLKRLQESSVRRVLSLDPLDHPALTLRRTVPAGPPGLHVHVYDLGGAWPREYVACRVLELPGSFAEQRTRVFAPDVDPARDVVLGEGHAECGEAAVRRAVSQPGEVVHDVVSDGAGYLVLRDSFARGWRAELDGRPAPVLRANGRHRAVALPAGRHRIRQWYEPPGLRRGLVVTVAAVGVLLLVLFRGATSMPGGAPLRG